MALWLAWIACTGPETNGPRPDPTEPTSVLFDGAVPKNVVMLSIDTLRRDIHGRYDPHGRGLTPFLDQISAEGVAFDDVTSCANHTHAATTCLISGTSTVDAADARGMVTIIGIDIEPYPEGTPMLPAFLAPYGYSSLLVSANTIFGEKYRSAQGYDRIADVNGPAFVVWDQAEQMLDEAPLTEPFFLHLHFFDPHKTYVPPESYADERLVGIPEVPYNVRLPVIQTWLDYQIGTLEPEERANVELHLNALYEAEVRWLDDQLRDIWAELDARGLLDDTLVVLWSDHGEAMFEHDYNNHARLLFPNENDAFVTLWARNIVPRTVAAPIELIDVVPTLFELWDRPIPDGVTGLPWDPEAVEDPDRIRTAFASGYFGPVNLARRGRWALQYGWIAEQPIALVDLQTDPDGVVNLYDPASPHPEAVALWPTIEAEVNTVLPYLERDSRDYVYFWPDELSAR